MILNGKRVDYEVDITVEELLASLKLEQGTVVIEVDQNIIYKDEYSTKKLSSESKVEVIRFMGGG